MSKKLILLRHAKAEPGDGRDQTRHLSTRGRAQAQAVGHELAVRNLVPDSVLCSCATRTQETWALASAQWDVEATSKIPVAYSEDVYRAYVAELLDAVHAVAQGTQTVLVVGHNPAVSATAFRLANPAISDPAAFAETRVGLSTASFFVLSFDGEWTDLGWGMARLTQLGHGHVA